MKTVGALAFFLLGVTPFERGRVSEGKLNHIVETEDPSELVRNERIDLRERKGSGLNHG